MPDNETSKLPSEVRELPDHAQQIFLAALNSAQSDGMSEDAATQVGWNSVKQQYEQGEDGKWQHKEEQTGSQGKPTMVGGN